MVDKSPDYLATLFKRKDLFWEGEAWTRNNQRKKLTTMT
jgi:hypothetical protein